MGGGLREPQAFGPVIDDRRDKPGVPGAAPNDRYFPPSAIRRETAGNNVGNSAPKWGVTARADSYMVDGVQTWAVQSGWGRACGGRMQGPLILAGGTRGQENTIPMCRFPKAACYGYSPSLS